MVPTPPNPDHGPRVDDLPARLCEEAGPLVDVFSAALRIARRALDGEPPADADLDVVGTARVLGPRDALAQLALGARAAPSPHDALSLACAQLAEWCHCAGMRETAARFAQAAAGLDPSSAPAALLAGERSLRAADLVRATAHLHHAVALSRRDPPSYVAARTTWASLLARRGKATRAERSYQRALAVARSAGLRAQEGIVLHDLFLLEAERASSRPDRLRVAEGYAAAAARALPHAHPRLLALAIDAADFLVEHRRFLEALSVASRAAAAASGETRLRACGLLARAAGAVGERGVFRAATLVLRQAPTPVPVATLTLAARGAYDLGLPADAAALLREPISRLMARGEAAAARRLRHLLDHAPAAAPAPVHGDVRLRDALVAALSITTPRTDPS